MDDFNNFFDDQRQTAPQHTPIYHTPEPKQKGPKANVGAIVCIVIAVIMCVMVVVNVIVLSTLKDSIASEYASQMSEQMRKEYEQAIKDALAGTDVITDVTDNATQQVIDALDKSIGEIANGYASSVARLYMYASSTASTYDKASGLATGFLITDTDESGSLERYVVTNAHCVRYAKSVTGGWWGSGTTRYEWASYGRIICVFEDDNTYYDTEIIAYGSYNDTDHGLRAENDQPDIAILRIKGTQPSNESHPSLRLAKSDEFISRGTPVALIGNPEGIGETNSITSGTVSQTGISIASWGSGKFIMTDAAVNGGNSGGPMLDSRGVVIGVVESKLVSDDIDNMGFALSADTLREFIAWAQQAQNNTLRTALSLNCTFI